MNKKYIYILLVILGLSLVFAGCSRKDMLKPEDRTSSIEEDIPPVVENIPEEVRENTQMTILAVGDIMFHMPQIRAAYDENIGTYDFKDNFKYVKKYIESADLAIANFETVTAGEDIPYCGFPNFNAPVETLDAIKYAGFDILTTSNNHCLDQGKKGLLNTIYAIEERGLVNIGTYKEPKEIMIKDINDIKLALLSYTYGFNGMDFTLTEEEKTYMVSKIDEFKIEQDIKKAKDEGVDMIVVFIHWGNEYQRDPSNEQVELGRKMIEWGANIILGSHPHVVQKAEVINYNGRDNFIIYSMGNFLSNQRRETMDNKYAEDGLMVRLTIEKDYLKNKTTIQNIEYIPTWVRRCKQNGKWSYQILPIEEFLKDKSLLSNIEKLEIEKIEESLKNTLTKVTEY
ncbi:poly-gamma-glutamate synthesis protein (capsule biosynthesis protein) [Keratinibaculum paraultunense]|uniref:Poly-gamma-glutamate synthesis protein (Capsule biosynthesis protein) n=1 Tax=Keratinibaculum paraultunense TaxID=1278232 RepID=A0A4R3KQ85_9FIRM|nr:CapA family protein [Keratinibaculum paraultunense]QQY79347.1 CapA family protein [Keratinibaculum paraultunense]TCS86634.1 poly-gamma-glutamate synthesis protein (capsule biosynthesis protein) [Keratinibaculum paraultunense]